MNLGSGNYEPEGLIDGQSYLDEELTDGQTYLDEGVEMFLPKYYVE